MTLQDRTAHNVTLRTNNVLAKMRKGEIAFGCQFNSPSSEQVELLGIAGYDFVIFDGEHGTFTLSDLGGAESRRADLRGLTPVGMVPDVELPTIHSFLERGIMGIHAPNITTEEDAQKLAEGCRYAPEGQAQSVVLAGDSLRVRAAEAGVHGAREHAGGCDGAD